MNAESRPKSESTCIMLMRAGTQVYVNPLDKRGHSVKGVASPKARVRAKSVLTNVSSHAFVAHLIAIKTNTLPVDNNTHDEL